MAKLKKFRPRKNYNPLAIEIEMGNAMVIPPDE